MIERLCGLLKVSVLTFLLAIIFRRLRQQTNPSLGTLAISGSAVSLLVVEPASQSPYVDAFTDADWMFCGDQLTFWNLQDGVLTVVGSTQAANA